MKKKKQRKVSSREDLTKKPRKREKASRVSYVKSTTKSGRLGCKSRQKWAQGAVSERGGREKIERRGKTHSFKDCYTQFL